MTDIGLPVASDDGTLRPEHKLWAMSAMTVDAAAKLGRPIGLAAGYADMFARAGFEDVELRLFKWPSNQWPRDPKFKTLGLWNLANIDGGLEGLTLALFTRGLGLTAEETAVYCDGARRELRDTSIHAYWPV